MGRTGIFISYRRIDTNWAAVALRAHIARELPGATVFMDIDSIEPGLDFRQVIHDNVDRCAVLLAVIGANWLTVSDNHGRRRLDMPTDWVRTEIARALERSIRVVPVLVDSAAMPPDDALPEPLQPIATRNAMTVGQASHSRDFTAITEFLGRHLPETRTTPPAGPAPKPAEPADTGRDRIGEAVAQALLDAGTDAKTMVTVGHLRTEAGDYAVAEAIYRAAQAGLEAAEDPDGDWAISNRLNLAYSILNQGRGKEAETMLRDLLPLFEKAKGKEHPDTLATRHTLARAVLDQGRAQEAEGLFRDLLPLVEKVEGKEHPNTLATRHELAAAILLQGCAQEAEGLYRDLLPRFEKAKGKEHPDTLTTRHTLALAVLDQGRAQEAERLFRDLLPLEERAKGKEDPDTLTTRRSLAWAALEQGAAERARAALAPLPEDGGDPDPLRKGQTVMLRGWLADLDGDAPRASGLLDRAEAHLAHLAPEHYARRRLARYRATRVPGRPGGTMTDQPPA